MTRKTTPRDLHQEITDKIVAAIEQGAGQWRMPWIAPQGGMPVNALMGKRYRGVNVLSLWLTASARGYASNEWASFKQWQQKGAQVRAGERGTEIVFYKRIERERTSETGDIEVDQIPLLRYSHVFNAAQVDGYQAKPAAPAPSLAQRLEAAEQFVAATGASIQYGNARAFYAPGLDLIAMPNFDQFIPTEGATATENAYGTLLHELTHWTGHKSRCARDFSGRFGDGAYAAEELVAELGAAFLSAELGISPAPRQDHAQYLAGWLKILKGDKKAIFTAASKASDAVDFLRDLQPATEAEELDEAATAALELPEAA